MGAWVGELLKTLVPGPMAAIAGSTKLAGGSADTDGNTGDCDIVICDIDIIAGSWNVAELSFSAQAEPKIAGSIKGDFAC